MTKRFITLFLQVILIVTSGCGENRKERRSPDIDSIGVNHPVQESWTTRLSISESGRERATIEAGHGAEYRSTAGTEHYLDKGIKVTFFDISGRAKATLTANEAVVHDNQDIEAKGNVVITSAGTTVIRTEYARRTGKDRMIRSDRFVTITRPGETIRGYGFESDEALKKYRIFRGSGEAFIKQ